MNFISSQKSTGKTALPWLASVILIISPAMSRVSIPSLFIEDSSTQSAMISNSETIEPVQTAPVLASKAETLLAPVTGPAETATYPFGNPAGCGDLSVATLTAEERLNNVQSLIGSEYDLSERRQFYIWNGELGSMVNVTNDPYVYEFTFNFSFR